MALFDLSSLRGKITSGYILLVAVTLLLGVITFLDLRFLERQVREGEVVSDLKDAVLEMRREEKNLFLYSDPQALTRAQEYAAVSLNILRKQKASLDAALPGSNLSATSSALEAYRELLARWDAASSGERQKIQQQIRSIGHQVYLAVEALAKRERRMLEVTIQESQWLLLVSLLVIGLGIYVIGRQLRRVAVRPLRQLESRLMSIAEGRFNDLRPPSRDREFLTLTEAFNRMLKELDIRQKRMLQSEKLASLGILASGVAHELNNPLSNISSSCQLLMEELTEADQQQLETWLKQIDRETERGRNIVRALLDFGSQRVFHRNKTKLSDLVDETLTIIGKTLRQNSAQLTIDIPAELTVKVDKQRIQQLLINLIQNAMHAAGKDVNLQISAEECEKDIPEIPDGAGVAGSLKCISDYTGRIVRLVVADNGPGIPAENLSRIFDPFFTTAEPGRGVGLGLFIVQEIVKEHDGCLAIISQPGEGTQVVILIPEEDSSDG
jgi:signal transduction histidine kinase